MAASKNNAPVPQNQLQPQAPDTAIQPTEPNMSERFTVKVMKEFAGSVGAPHVTNFQKRLIQGYFISIDRALKMAEEERQRKNSNNSDHSYDNDLPVVWANVNLNDLALDLVHYARLGLDMMQDNHLFPIPYKNNKRNCYDITLMEGYNGVRYIAERYAVEFPRAITVELVYSTDTFVPIKKDSRHNVETYEFTINDAFERGEVKGGFGYIEYDDPSKNELVIMSMKDIMKRKPAYASANFWGGKATEWKTVDGKRKKVEVEKEGWFEEMCRKTIMREVYSAKHIPRDPQKVDDTYQYLKMREAKRAEMEAQDIIDIHANGDVIDTTPELPGATPTALPEPTPGFTVDVGTGEVKEPIPAASPASSLATETTPDGQTMMGGPAF